MDTSKSHLKTSDARVRRVSMLDPYSLYLRRRHDAIPPEALARIAAELGSGLTKLTRFLLVLGILCVVPGVIAFAVHLTRVLAAGRWIWPLPIWLLPANFWVVPFAIWMGACQIRSRRIRSVMLRHRRCPHCGYDIRGLPVAPEDGATVCPECGCAWVLATPGPVADE